MIYKIYFADKGSPKTGLSPVIDVFIKVSDGSSAGTPPSVSELAGGGYKFDYTPTGDVFLRVDSEDESMDDQDRYIPMGVGLYDNFGATNYAHQQIAASRGYRVNTTIDVATASAPMQAVFRGDTPTFTFTVVDGSGDPIDLTDYDVYFAAKSDVSDDEYVFNNKCTVLVAEDGTCKVALSASDTAASGKYMAEVELVGKDGTDAEGKYFTASRFQLSIIEDVRK